MNDLIFRLKALDQLSAIIMVDCSHIHIKIHVKSLARVNPFGENNSVNARLVLFRNAQLEKLPFGRWNLLVSECELCIKSSLEWQHSVSWTKIKAKLNCIDIISGAWQKAYNP